MEGVRKGVDGGREEGMEGEEGEGGRRGKEEEKGGRERMSGERIFLE